MKEAGKYEVYQLSNASNSAEIWLSLGVRLSRMLIKAAGTEYGWSSELDKEKMNVMQYAVSYINIQPIYMSFSGMELPGPHNSSINLTASTKMMVKALSDLFHELSCSFAWATITEISGTLSPLPLDTRSGIDIWPGDGHLWDRFLLASPTPGKPHFSSIISMST
ncbi:hypothetical protein BDP27DRAFT_1422408 [Rhodocollybia butyracea]|uniref:Uncharacterized protein n=1 Tax=Rhodocollybia butyracea TaxID=206335 RepID=A0A9P5PRD8_9AGAR|nr:hypothetical protein BDP27DRAFT_1422408 [Rhodocollybia butyracea]